MLSSAVLWRGSWKCPLLFVYRQRGVIFRTRIMILVLDSNAVDFLVNLSLGQVEECSWKWNWVPLLSLCFNKRKRNVTEMYIKTSEEIFTQLSQHLRGVRAFPKSGDFAGILDSHRLRSRKRRVQIRLPSLCFPPKMSNNSASRRERSHNRGLSFGGNFTPFRP